MLTGAHMGWGEGGVDKSSRGAVFAEITSNVLKPLNLFPKNVNNFQLWSGCFAEIPASSISMSTSRSLSRGEPVNVRSPLL